MIGVVLVLGVVPLSCKWCVRSAPYSCLCKTASRGATRRGLGRLLLLGVGAVRRYTVLFNQGCARSQLGVLELQDAMRPTHFLL